MFILYFSHILLPGVYGMDTTDTRVASPLH